MRLLGLVGLVVVLAVVGLLVKNQAVRLAAPTAALPAGAATATPAQRHPLQDDVRRSLDAAMRQARPTADEAP